MAQTLTVELADRSYPIYFRDSRVALKATVAELRAAQRSVRVIADAGLMAAQPSFLTEAGFEASEILTLPAGEPTKSIEQFSRCLSFLASNSLNRNCAVFAFGGGVIGRPDRLRSRKLLARRRFLSNPDHPALHGGQLGWR